MKRNRTSQAIRKTMTLLLFGMSSMVCLSQTTALAILPNADPFITLHPVHGKYLLLATTGHNITIWSGPTIATAATDARIVFTPPDSLTQLWSPTIWKTGNRWWIYFTALQHGAGHAIYALESDTNDPLGSYTYRGPLDLGRPAIDPSVLTVNGLRYLMYVTVDRNENAINIVRLATPMQPLGTGVQVSEPEFPWEKGAGTTKTYPVNEGPTALYHDGKIFIVYSASDTASPAYCLGLLTLVGADPLKRDSWVKTPHPVFIAAPEHNVYGPGRGTFAQASDGAYWLLYAAKSTSEPTPAHRETRAQPFTWNPDGTPNFGIALSEK